jgi:hypothetical protein
MMVHVLCTLYLIHLTIPMHPVLMHTLLWVCVQTFFFQVLMVASVATQLTYQIA